MFNVYGVREHASARHRPSVTRGADASTRQVPPPVASSSSSPTHRAPSKGSDGRASPTPKAPYPHPHHGASTTVPVVAASASPTGGRGQARTVPQAMPSGRPQASSVPNSTNTNNAPLQRLPYGVAHDHTTAMTGARSSLPRRRTDAPPREKESYTQVPTQPARGVRQERDDEPVPSAPSSQLPSHVRRLPGDSRSPSGGTNSANPYINTGPAARASVIPPEESARRPVKSQQQQQQPPPQRPSQQPSPKPSALALAREKESRVSRVKRLTSPQRDRVHALPDADTTLPHEDVSGDVVEGEERWGQEINAQCSGVRPLPQPTDYYDGTRGIGAHVEILEKVTRGAHPNGINRERSDETARGAGSDVAEVQKPRDVRTAAPYGASGGTVVIAERSQTPPHPHAPRRRQTDLAGATPWHGQKTPSTPSASSTSETPYAEASAARRTTPHTPPQPRPDAVSRPGPPPPPPPAAQPVYRDEVIAVSLPRQALRMNRFARYLESPADASVERRRAAGGPARTSTSPARILPETSPYCTRTLHDPSATASTSPMRQPSWGGASESVAVPRDAPDSLLRSTHHQEPLREGPPSAAYLDRYPSEPHPKLMYEDSHSVTSTAPSTTASTSARQSRPHGRPRPAAHAARAQQPPPSAPTRENVSAWTARTAAPAESSPSVAPRPPPSVVSEVSSLASSLRQTKRQRRPSWQRLAPFFPNLTFEGKSDARIVREMEEELRMLSSPPKSASRMVPRREPQLEHRPPQDEQKQREQPPAPVPASSHDSKALMTSMSDLVVGASQHGGAPQQKLAAQLPSPPLSATTQSVPQHDELTDRYAVGGPSTRSASTAQVSGVPPMLPPQPRVLHASECASPAPASAHSVRAPSAADSQTEMQSVPGDWDGSTSACDALAASGEVDRTLRPLAGEETEAAQTVMAPMSSATAVPTAPGTGADTLTHTTANVTAPATQVKPIALDRLRAREHSADDAEARDGSSPRTTLVTSGKSSPRYFAPRSQMGGTALRTRISAASSSTLASLHPSSRTAPAAMANNSARAFLTTAGKSAQPTREVSMVPPWMCADAVEDALLDAYMLLCDLESQYFRFDMDTQEEIEDTVHIVELNEYGRVTGVPRCYRAKGAEQEILPMLRAPEGEPILSYDLSRQGFLNLCAGMWLTRFQSWQGIRDLTAEMSWTAGSPSASFSLLRQSYRIIGPPSTSGGVLSDEARAADMWLPEFNRPTDLMEQLDNVVSWAVRTWIERQVSAKASSAYASTNGSLRSRTPFDAASLATNTDGNLAIVLARRKGPPASATAAANAMHGRTSSPPSDGALQSISSDVHRDPVALFCARDLTDDPLHLACWPDAIWTTSNTSSLVEHATHFLLCSLDPHYAEKRAEMIDTAASSLSPNMEAAQRSWDLFLGAAQWNSDDTMTADTANIPPRAARVAYSFVSRARTYNLTGGVGALFFSFLTNQLPETAFFDSMFLLEKLRLALLYSRTLHANAASPTHGRARPAQAVTKTFSNSSRLDKMQSNGSASGGGGGGALTEMDDDDNNNIDSIAPTVYDVSLSLRHFFPLKTPSSLLVLYEALVQDLQHLHKLTHLEALVADRDVHASFNSPPGPGPATDATAELVEEWEELGTEASATQSAAAAEGAKTPSTPHNNNIRAVDGADEQHRTLASEAARAMLWAASLHGTANIVLPVSRMSTPASPDSEDRDVHGEAVAFLSPLLSDADVWELLSTPVPVDTLFRYQMKDAPPLITIPSRSAQPPSPSTVPAAHMEASLLYMPPVGCKSRLVETVRLQYVCELLQYTTDMQEAILSAKRYESPTAAARLAQQKADLSRRAQAEQQQEDGVLMGSCTNSSVAIDDDESAVEINEGANVTSVRAVLVALQRADPQKKEEEVQNYLRHLLVLYFSTHTLEDLLVNDEEPEDVQAALNTAADLSLRQWFTATVREPGQSTIATALCDKVFVHIQELAGLCPRVLARRASTLDDPFAVEL